MNKRIVVLAIVTLLLQPAALTSFREESYINNGVTVRAWLSADVPWFSPFSQNVTVDLFISAFNASVIEINVTKIILSVNKRDISSDTYSLITAAEKSFTPNLVGTQNIVINETVVISGLNVGQECYFALVIEGFYRTTDNITSFSSTSPENFVGSFSILGSLGSPLTIVGILVIAIFSFVIIGGLYAAKRSQGAKRRRPSLMQD